MIAVLACDLAVVGTVKHPKDVEVYPRETMRAVKSRVERDFGG